VSRIKTFAGVLIFVLLAAAALSVVLSTQRNIKVSADFERVTGLYTGSEVRMLGIPIGKITDVEPQGQSVRVSMSVQSKYRVPANAEAVIVPPSLIADRYVQFTPAYTGGPLLRNNAHIPIARTQVPVELGTVLQSLDQLSVALGPNGANKNGALSKLVTVAANNLRGNGEQIHSTVRDVSTLLTTLADNKTDLVGTINNLDQFVHALRNSDGAVRTLTRDLASVASQLSGDRQNLASAIQTLGVALGDVTQLVRTNRQTLVADVHGLTDVTSTLLRQKQALSEILDNAPLALQNLNGAYDPEVQALRTKSDNQIGSNPQLYVCQILKSLLPAGSKDLCNATGAILGDPNNPVGQIIGNLPGNISTLPRGN